MVTATALQSSSPLGEHDHSRPHVVLVDDDRLFRESLGPNLSDNGFAVTEFDGGGIALDYFGNGGTADLVLLDWRMPEIDGLEVLRRLRREKNGVPIIFLTVLDDEIYEEAALAGGAVDFVEKSRSLPILLRRISLILDGRKNTEDRPEIGHFGDLELLYESKRARWKGDFVSLTLTEFNILIKMTDEAGSDVPYRDIYDLVHGQGFIAGSGSEGYRANVRTFIKRIRKKFREIDDSFDHIQNYPGFGYRWRSD